MSNTAVICPVSNERINENVARVAALITIALTIVAMYCSWPLLMVALAADFYLRAFTKGYYSPVKAISKSLVSIAHLPKKPGDAAPKKFAAALGLIFTASIAILQALQYTVAADAVAGVLLFCAALEGLFGICLGCIVYTWAVLPIERRLGAAETIVINL